MLNVELHYLIEKEVTKRSRMAAYKGVNGCSDVRPSSLAAHKSTLRAYAPYYYGKNIWVPMAVAYSLANWLQYNTRLTHQWRRLYAV
jgi:hypothetical protein